MGFIKTINQTFGMAFGVASSYGVGYVYGALTNVNKTVAARAFALSAAVALTFELGVKIATGGKEKNAKGFYATHLIGGIFLGAIQLVAFRRLNLIAQLGTAFLAFNLGFRAFTHLNGLVQAYRQSEAEIGDDESLPSLL